MVTHGAETLRTERKTLKAKLKCHVCQGAEKLSSLTLDVFFIAGLDGYLQQLNPMCERILGFSTEDLLSQPWLELVHPEDQASTYVHINQLTAGENSVSFENRYLCKNGSYKWLFWKAMLCQEQQLVYAMAYDQTQSKQSQAAQLESEECFRLLADSAKDYALVKLDSFGRIVSWNRGAENLQQYKLSEIVGQHVSCFYTEEELELDQPEQGLNIAAAQGYSESVGWQVRKDGSLFWAKIVTTALRTEEGQLRGFARVTRDLTESKNNQESLPKAEEDLEERVKERTAELTKLNEQLKQEIAQHKQTESQLLQSQARLQNQVKQYKKETEQAKSLLKELQTSQATLIQTEKMLSLRQIVAGIAHEINNPVSFIYGNIDYASCYIKDLMKLVKLYGIHYPQPVSPIQAEIDAIDLDFLRSDLPKLLASMKVGATRIRQVVLALQKFLTAEQVEMKATDLHEGLESILLILQYRLKATVERPDITVIKDYGNLPPVDCYTGSINQVFMNLITNAVDALEESTEIWHQPRCIKISTSVEEISRDGSDQSTPHALIRIADNGPGMSESVSQRIFEQCFTTKPVGKGTGLGLLISYQIVVERHDGQLSCISQPGKGAEFTIALPLEQRV